MDGAGAALAVVAALLRAGEVSSFAQAVEQRRARIDVKLVLLAVDPQRDWHRAAPPGRRNVTGCRALGHEVTRIDAATTPAVPEVARKVRRLRP